MKIAQASDPPPLSQVESHSAPRARAALWGTIKRLDRGKLNSPAIAFRNALAVALPLGVGIAIGNPLGAVAVTTGALNVSYSDGTDPYKQRARRMLTWSFLGAFAVFAGSATGRFHVVAILIAMLWAFVAGMLIAVSSRAGDLGLNTFVALIVFAARGPTTMRGCVDAAVLVLAGGLLQTLFALLFWPVRRSEPERRAVASVYSELAKDVEELSDSLLQAPLAKPHPEIQDTLDALGGDHTFKGERIRLLFDQADRIRLSAFQLFRLRSQFLHVARHEERNSAALPEHLDEIFSSASRVLHDIARCLISDKDCDPLERFGSESQHQVSSLRAAANLDDALENDIACAADVLEGQLRSAARLAASTTPVGEEQFQAREEAMPFRLRVGAWLEVLRANLTLQSAIYRHAIRVAICAGIGDAFGHAIGWDRSYWLPMTVAVILKPDFTTTFSRGVLRLCGTLAGLILATVLYHVLPGTAFVELLLVGLFTFFLRMYGPANYGVFSVAVSGLIVFLIAETGVPPAQVVLLRGLNTTAGGILALIAYGMWPTWERKHVSVFMAEMVDAIRAYFHVVLEHADEPEPVFAEAAEQARQAWRRARSNAEASVDRVSSEPGASPREISSLASMLASSHALTHAILELEAGFLQSPLRETPGPLKSFSHDVEFTLYFVAGALRGSSAAANTLPKLREDHRRLVEARQTLGITDEFVLAETDRVTVSLNTLREQVMRYVARA